MIKVTMNVTSTENKVTHNFGKNLVFSTAGHLMFSLPLDAFGRFHTWPLPQVGVSLHCRFHAWSLPCIDFLQLAPSTCGCFHASSFPCMVVSMHRHLHASSIPTLISTPGCHHSTSVSIPDRFYPRSFAFLVVSTAGCSLNRR